MKDSYPPLPRELPPPPPRTHSRIAPEPIEAPEPQREERRRDLVREEALRLGCQALHDRGFVLVTSEAFRAGVEAYEAHLSRWDYRGKR